MSQPFPPLPPFDDDSSPQGQQNPQSQPSPNPYAQQTPPAQGQSYAGQQQYPAPQQGQTYSQGQQYPGQGYPTQQGSRYGTTPYQAAGPYGAPVERPKSFDTLLKLTLASLGIWVLSTVLSFIFRPSEEQLLQSIRDQFEAAGQPVDDATVQAALDMGMAVGIASSVVMLILGIGLYLLVYLPLRNGKNWARVLGIVLAIIGIIFTAVGYTQLGVYSGVGLALSIATGVLFIVANVFWLMMAFKPEVAAYTRAASERPRF